MTDNSDFDKIVIGSDILVNRLGLGTNRIQNDNKSKEALKAAVDLGINFIDTASAYSGGISEKVIGETLSPYENVVIATKGGMVAPDFHIDSSPQTLSRSLENSLEKLKLKTIPLYFLHRVDPDIPFEDSLLFLKQMQEQGKIKHIGLSQVSIEQLKIAKKYIKVVAVENEYNITERNYDDVVTYAEKENMVFIPFFPLHIKESAIKNFKELQNKYQTTAAQLAIAWLLKRSPAILPIPGSLSTKHLQENVAAMTMSLSDEDFSKLSNY